MKRQRSLQPHPDRPPPTPTTAWRCAARIFRRPWNTSRPSPATTRPCLRDRHACRDQPARAGAASGGTRHMLLAPCMGRVGRTAAPARRQQHGLLRRCRHRAHGIGLGLERDRPPGYFRQSRRDGRVVCTHARRTGRQAGLSHRRQRGRTAFAPCPACRPQHAVQRAPPVIGQRARRGRRRLGPVPRRRPAKPSCAWCPSIAPWPPRCCGLGRATRSILSAPAIPATARGAVPAARQARSGQQLGKIDALLLTSDIVMRGIASDLARERPFPRPVRPGFTAWP